MIAMAQEAAENRQIVEDAFQRAEHLRKERRLLEARDVLIEALKYNVHPAQVYFRLGNIYHDQKEYDRAEYAYRRAIDHDPRHINAHHNLSVVCKRQGKLADSIKLYKQANKLARQHPERVKLTSDQIVSLRRFALRFLLIGVGAIAGFVGLLLLLSWLTS